MKLRRLTLKFKSHGQMSSRTSHLILSVELEDQPAHFRGHFDARVLYYCYDFALSLACLKKQKQMCRTITIFPNLRSEKNSHRKPRMKPKSRDKNRPCFPA